jgi:hypothetical protein
MSLTEISTSPWTSICEPKNCLSCCISKRLLSRRGNQISSTQRGPFFHGPCNQPLRTMLSACSVSRPLYSSPRGISISSCLRFGAYSFNCPSDISPDSQISCPTSVKTAGKQVTRWRRSRDGVACMRRCRCLRESTLVPNTKVLSPGKWRSWKKFGSRWASYGSKACMYKYNSRRLGSVRIPPRGLLELSSWSGVENITPI